MIEYRLKDYENCASTRQNKQMYYNRRELLKLILCEHQPHLLNGKACKLFSTLVSLLLLASFKDHRQINQATHNTSQCTTTINLLQMLTMLKNCFFA